jgi:N-acetylmuramoyl-L-alanine amidase
MKILKLLLIMMFPLNLYCQEDTEKNETSVRTVVIDPGHGGAQPGALGLRVPEKQINLAVALKLGKIIEEWYPSVKVLYTRTKDVSLGLMERSDFANKNNADLFISIHANSTEGDKEKARGSETYIMGLHNSEENLKVAMFENSSIKDEENYQTKYDGFDPSSPESYIMLSLMQDAYMEQSLKIAEYIQEEFQNGPVKKDRGVKQLGLLVLAMTSAPRVLVELGFLSNPQEELILMDEDNQQKMAECIFKAFKRYKEEMETP